MTGRIGGRGDRECKVPSNQAVLLLMEKNGWNMLECPMDSRTQTKVRKIRSSLLTYNSKCRDLKTKQNTWFMKVISGIAFSESTSRLELTKL